MAKEEKCCIREVLQYENSEVATHEGEQFEERLFPLGKIAVEALRQMVGAVDSPVMMRELATFHGDQPGAVRKMAAYLFDDAVVADAFEYHCTHGIGDPFPLGAMFEQWCDMLLQHYPGQANFLAAKTHFTKVFKLIADRVDFLFNSQILGMFVSARPRGIRRWMTKIDREKMNCYVENGFYEILKGLDRV